VGARFPGGISLSRLSFPTDQAVGSLTWPSAEGNQPVLAVGDVSVPDGVEVSLKVGLIESTQVVDDGVGPISVRSVGPDPFEDRSFRAQTGPRLVRIGSRQPSHLGFLLELPPDSVTELYLRSSVVSQSFRAITHLAAGLRRLYLAETALTDEALRSIAELSGLTYLQSSGNKFTDAGVQKLKALRSLESLYLEERTLSAAAFEFTANLPRLVRLGIQDVQLTPGEVIELKARLPGVNVG
jgi:hypothetical protein